MIGLLHTSDRINLSKLATADDPVNLKANGQFRLKRTLNQSHEKAEVSSSDRRPIMFWNGFKHMDIWRKGGAWYIVNCEE